MGFAMEYEITRLEPEDSMRLHSESWVETTLSFRVFLLILNLQLGLSNEASAKPLPKQPEFVFSFKNHEKYCKHVEMIRKMNRSKEQYGT